MDWDRLRGALADLPAAAVEVPAGARVGAVLVLLRELVDDAELLLTRRREDLSTHAGQVAFPGGRVDRGEPVEAAAVREAAEEVDLDPASVELLGRLPSFFIPPSGYWLVPVVARWRSPHRLIAADAEVAAILPVTLSRLTDRATWRVTDVPERGRLWAWQLDRTHLLWGATAVAVAELLELARPGWRQGVRAADLAANARVDPLVGAAAPDPHAGEAAS